MRYYVCGFLFTPINHPLLGVVDVKVALIKKNRPKWQAGLYNGIGGKVEPGETPHLAIRREFWEETGTTIDNWKPFCTLIHSAVMSKSMPSGPWTVYFFKAFEVATLQSPTDEEVKWWDVRAIANRLNNYFVPNLQWLIPMAMEDITAEVQQHNWPHEA
jgi:8-oxo-dGTP diphosphatase